MKMITFINLADYTGEEGLLVKYFANQHHADLPHLAHP